MSEKGGGSRVEPLSPTDAEEDPRMKLYNDREQDFLDFVAESNAASGVDVDEGVEDRPLSGLQCLLALTEILERAAQLRLTNANLEQRINVLQRFKMITEVQNELHHAKLSLDVNANGLVRSKKSRTMDDFEHGGLSMKRSISVESLEAFTSARKYEHQHSHTLDDFSKHHRVGTGKGSKLSETWGRVKDKLAPKDVPHTTQTMGKSYRRHRSADLAGSLRAPSQRTDSSPSQSSVQSTPGTTLSSSLFTMREISISPPRSDEGDFGGVYLGEDTPSDVTKSPAAAVNTATNRLEEFGGVWLGPPSTGYAHSDSPAAAGNAGPELCPISIQPSATKDREDLQRKTSEPVRSSRRGKPVLPKLSLSIDSSYPTSAVRTPSFDELRNDNQSPTTIRKKSSKLFAQAAHLLPGSEQKKIKKVENVNELPKEFRRKIEEWHVIKDATSTPTAQDAPDSFTAAAPKASKGTKSKNQRFKNKKRGGLLKQRSKSADRVEDRVTKNLQDDEFEKKLRAWSLKQGYPETYYSEARDRQRSADSVGEMSYDESNPDDLNMKSNSDDYLVVNSHISSCTDSSTCSLSPSTNTTNYMRSADNLHTLHETSQSSDRMFDTSQPPERKFYRGSSSRSSVNRNLSRSEETLNTPVGHMLASPIEKSPSATSSNMDLYAQASDRLLEKHISLYHVTSESSVYQSGSSVHLDQHTNSNTSLGSVDNSYSEDFASKVRKLTEESFPSEVSINDLDLELSITESRGKVFNSQDNISIVEDTIIDNISKMNESVAELCLSDSLSNSMNDEPEVDQSEVEVEQTPTETLEYVITSPAIAVAAISENVEYSQEPVVETITIATPVATTESASDISVDSANSSVSDLEEDIASTEANSSPNKEIMERDIAADVYPAAQNNLKTNISKLNLKLDLEDSYDVNSNVTNGELTEQTIKLESNDSPQSSPVVSPLYVGTETPLKLRLKSLALEYEQESTKTQQNATPHYYSNSDNRKRTRSYTETNRKLTPTTSSPQGNPLINLSHNQINKPQRSNVHRLKSADELIYEQSAHTKRKHYTRSDTVDHLKYPRFNLGSRRDYFEKPKEGTVKKAMSMFLDSSGSFNPQFGTDFGRPTRRREPT